MSFTRLALALAICVPMLAQGDRLEWWREARFGMFIHWGLYAVPAGEWNGKASEGLGEWIMFRSRIPVKDYEKLAPQFNPVRFNADEWVALAKAAGMKYIVITSKHHDGFAMYGSKASRYNIVDATPFHRDPIKELAAACQRNGIRLCFYYSQTQDWHEPDGNGNSWGWPDESRKNFPKYWDEKVLPQVRELLTNYGPIGLIWFDTPKDITKAQSQQLADLVHSLQPNCLVSGRVGNGVGDYDSAGDNQISVGKVKREWETPVTLNDTWGFRKDDHNWKSTAVLIRQMAMTASRNGNYLLNVGPTAEGVIPQPSVERLREVGEWMKANGESIYGTAASPFPYDLPWGVMTSKPGKLYVHLFTWPGQQFELYGLRSKVTRAYLLSEPGKTLTVEQRRDASINHEALTVQLSAAAPDLRDAVLVIETGTSAPEAIQTLLQQPDGSVMLLAYAGNFHGTVARADNRGVMERWSDKAEWMDWTFQVSKPGAFDVEVITSEQKHGKGWDGGHKVVLDVAGRKVEGVMKDDGKLENPANPYWPYVRSRIGSVEIGKGGTYAVSLKPESIAAGKFGLTLVSVVLVPRK